MKKGQARECPALRSTASRSVWGPFRLLGRVRLDDVTRDGSHADAAHGRVPLRPVQLLAAGFLARGAHLERVVGGDASPDAGHRRMALDPDRKSTRLNSSHGYISYAVFCLKKKKQKDNNM